MDIKQLLSSHDEEMIYLGINIISQTEDMNKCLELVIANINSNFSAYIDDPLGSPEIKIRLRYDTTFVKDPTRLLKLISRND